MKNPSKIIKNLIYIGNGPPQITKSGSVADLYNLEQKWCRPLGGRCRPVPPGAMVPYHSRDHGGHSGPSVPAGMGRESSLAELRTFCGAGARIGRLPSPSSKSDAFLGILMIFPGSSVPSSHSCYCSSKTFVTLRAMIPDPYRPVPMVLSVPRGPQSDGGSWHRVAPAGTGPQVGPLSRRMSGILYPGI